MFFQTERLKLRLGLLIASAFMTGAAVEAQMPTTGKSLWGIKPLPIDVIKKKAQFPVLVPADKSLQIDKAEIAWMPKSAMFSEFPSRQAVCLTCSYKQQPVVVIQVKALSGYDPRKISPAGNDSLWQAIAQGYFFQGIRNGVDFESGRKGNTDILILATSSDMADQIALLFTR